MPKFAANLSTMFTELPFLERFAAAAEVGFRGVEYIFPYDYEVPDMQERLHQYQLQNVLFNLPPGNWSTGERGIACLPGREEEFRAGVEVALSYAIPLQTKTLHAMAGIAPQSVNPGDLRTVYIRNLQHAARRCAEFGITLVIEALNTRDMPGYYLNTQAESYEICKLVNASNLKMQMDCYHMQIMEGDLAIKLRKYIDYCGHVQVAGVPDRHEPSEGEVNYRYLFQLLDEIGYGGWVGCEYRPRQATLAGLGWLTSLANF